MRPFISLMKRAPGILAGGWVVYDAEAVAAFRKAKHAQLEGRRIDEPSLVRAEVELARHADAVTCVSRAEAEHFRRLVKIEPIILGHSVPPRYDPTAVTPFSKRDGALFIGALYVDGSPNVDSLIWYIENVMPILTDDGLDRLIVVGDARASSLAKYKDRDNIAFTGPVADPTPYFNRAKCLIAPTRFAAGLPYKVHDAASRGLPCVATKLIADQLGWSHADEIMVGDTPETFAAGVKKLATDRNVWAAVAGGAIARVIVECNPVDFNAALAAALLRK
jgi:hypothetical protein